MADRFISYSCRRNNLSFSSTLLEEICQSIDRESLMRKKGDDDDATARFFFKTEEEMANYQRACMIDKWMEKKLLSRGKSLADLQEKDLQYSSSSSSDSSCGDSGSRRRGGFFSSSEPESFRFHQPKPVRTGKLGFEKEKPKNDSRFVKTKSKALKIYGDLKKVKQPISPGGKVAAFLNSLFSAGNMKKSKISTADSPSLKSTTTTTTTCSSASSFSRSCLSKTTTSSKFAGSGKRSVRFFPVSVTVDEDCRPCGNKSLLHQNNNNDGDDLIEAAIDEELAMHVIRKKERDQMGCEFEHSFDVFSRILDQNRSLDQELSDDGASCASSDLFELENLSAIGMEELPVYETTRLEKIQTVAANGLIL